MQLEGYFDFLAPDDIRVKGHRIGIETILYQYIHESQTAEEISQSLPSLTLEEVYATILYYLHNKEKISAYLADWLEYCLQTERDQRLTPPPAVIRMRQIIADQKNIVLEAEYQK